MREEEREIQRERERILIRHVKITSWIPALQTGPKYFSTVKSFSILDSFVVAEASNKEVSVVNYCMIVIPLE